MSCRGGEPRSQTILWERMAKRILRRPLPRISSRPEGPAPRRGIGESVRASPSSPASMRSTSTSALFPSTLPLGTGSVKRERRDSRAGPARRQAAVGVRGAGIGSFSGISIGRARLRLCHAEGERLAVCLRRRIGYDARCTRVQERVRPHPARPSRDQGMGTERMAGASMSSPCSLGATGLDASGTYPITLR